MVTSKPVSESVKQAPSGELFISFDFRHFLQREPEIHRADDTVHLLRVSHTGNRAPSIALQVSRSKYRAFDLFPTAVGRIL
jgi:hypothetical protein